MCLTYLKNTNLDSLAQFELLKRYCLQNQCLMADLDTLLFDFMIKKFYSGL